MVHIPYRGSAPVVTDLLAGQVDVMFDNVPNVIQHVRAGKMKALAVTTAKRSPLAPEVPSLDEAGVPGYDLSVWFGVLAPAGTPKDIVNKLNAEINAALKLPEVRSKLEAAGIEVQGGTPEQYAAVIKSDLAKWGKVVREANIQPE